MDIVFGIILLIAAVFLVIAVLMQSGKSKNLSGAIAGGAETFFGKEKGKTLDKLFSKLTTIVAIVFVVLVIIVYVIQEDNVYDADASFDELFTQSETVGDAAAETTAAAEETTVAAVEEAAE